MFPKVLSYMCKDVKKNMRDVSLGDLADLYVYCVLVVYPDKSLENAYHGFADFLVRKGINPQYENFMTVYHAGQAAREASPLEQNVLLKAIGKPKLLSY